MFKYKNYIIVAALMLFCFSPGAVRAGQQLPVYELIVSIDPARHTIHGSVRITVQKGTACKIRMADLTIARLLVNSRETRPVQGIIDIRDTQSDTVVEITYSASFAPGPAEQKGDFLNSSAPNSISSEGVMLLHDWYPTIDGLGHYKLSAVIPEHFEAVSESETTAVKSSSGMKNITFDFPHPLPGVTLIAGAYVTRTESFHDIALKTFFFAEDQTLADNYLANTKRYIELYESLLGPFPYKTFAIVENRFQTGYSLPTYTLLGSQVIRLPFIVETSLGHEILHQWFGNHVYVNYAAGNWSEGLTTYLSDHWYSHLKGSGAEYRKKILSDYMNYVTPANEITLREFRGPDSYSARAVGYGKAAMVFHMLRMKLGDELFFKALREFISSFQYRAASWNSLRDSFTFAGKQDLKAFFQQWVDRKGVPDFSLARPQAVFREGAFQLSFDVFQEKESFACSLPARITTEQGTEKIVIEITGEDTHYEKKFAGRPLKIILDEQYDVMRRLVDAEAAPVISAFIGNRESIVITPLQDEKIYRETARFFKAQGYTVKSEKETSFTDIEKTSILFLSDTGSFYRKLFADRTLPAGGCVLKVSKNPLNSKKVAAVYKARSAEEADAAYRKIFRYGNYSLLVFEQGKIIRQESASSEQGIVEDLQVAARGVKTKDALDLDAIIKDVRDKRVIYIGESHTAYADHLMQLEIIRRLVNDKQPLIIGMEMFQRPFQKYLDQYIQKRITEEEFLKKSEYFSRWAYDYNLYRDILQFARANTIPVIALNVRREITEKVSDKGMDSLTAGERAELPPNMDLTNEQYREYLKQIYYQHEQSKKTCFDNFYFSQILWDETMAHSIAEALQKYPDARMVVLAGSGHLQYAWGIPARVQRLTGSTSALILNDSGQGVEQNLADYILFPAPADAPESPKLQVLLKKDNSGVVIEKVMKDGPGQKAGLKEGDIIKTIDNTVIEDIADIKILLLRKQQGGSITIKVQRKQKDGKTQDMKVTVAL
jgi:uncharacterized iron-regulated protein